MEINSQVILLTFIFGRIVHFLILENTIFADQNVIRIFFYESSHHDTKNIGLAEIHTSMSQFLTHPTDQQAFITVSITYYLVSFILIYVIL